LCGAPRFTSAEPLSPTSSTSMLARYRAFEVAELMTANGVERSVPVFDSDLRPSPFLDEFRELCRFSDLVLLWAQRNLMLRYKRSFLGILWTLLELLMLMSILTASQSAPAPSRAIAPPPASTGTDPRLRALP
jgi:hypothetical protein